MSGINWDLVRNALEISATDEGLAETVLNRAIAKTSGCTGDCGNCGGESAPTEKAVDYGVGSNGGYTDANDPRKASANRHAGGTEGPVTAVHTLVLTNPSTPFKCVNVEAYGPGTAIGGGRTIVRVTQGDGNYKVILGTGASKNRGDYDDRIPHLPGQEVVIAGTGVKFTPPNLGGASIFLQDSNGNIVSDEVRSLGLPFGQHVVYTVAFARR